MLASNMDTLVVRQELLVSKTHTGGQMDMSCHWAILLPLTLLLPVHRCLVGRWFGMAIEPDLFAAAAFCREKSFALFFSGPRVHRLGHA